MFPGCGSPSKFSNPPLPTCRPAPAGSRWSARCFAERLATLLHSLEQRLEETIETGGSADGEPYRSALPVAKVIVGATAD